MLLMIRHWMGLQRNSRDGGLITCGSYITYIGDRLGLDFTTHQPCKRSTVIDAKGLQAAHFIRVQSGSAGFPDRYIWRFGDGHPDRPLPFECPISFVDTRTWRLEAPIPPPQPEPQPPHVASPLRHEASPSRHADVHMEDAPFPPHLHHPSSSSSSISMQDLYELMTQIREEQRDMRAHFDHRLSALEVELAFLRPARERQDDDDDGAGPS